MVRAMLVVNGAVENVAVFETEADIFDGWAVCLDDIGPGFTDNGDGTFSPPVVTE